MKPEVLFRFPDSDDAGECVSERLKEFMPLKLHTIWSKKKGALLGRLIFSGMTGLEPAAPAVTGQYSNQLSYIPSFPDFFTLPMRKARKVRKLFSGGGN